MAFDFALFSGEIPPSSERSPLRSPLRPRSSRKIRPGLGWTPLESRRPLRLWEIQPGSRRPRVTHLKPRRPPSKVMSSWNLQLGSRWSPLRSRNPWEIQPGSGRVTNSTGNTAKFGETNTEATKEPAKVMENDRRGPSQRRTGRHRKADLRRKHC